MIDARFRPMPIWPHGTTPADARRSRWTFKASWQNTLDLLDRELRHVQACDVVIGCGLREQDIRLDGWPRAGAREPSHPGVELSFASLVQSQRLVYATDVCERWEHNVRAIALGLEALRAVRNGASAGRGREIIRRHGSIAAALKATHPDHGGDPADFADVQAAREEAYAA